MITALFQAISTLITLPQHVEIVFDDLGPAVYGDTKIDARFKNRVTVNTQLQVGDLPSVLVHEFIHVHQSHTGLLSADYHGNVYWRNRRYSNIDELTWDEYCQLPWEADVLAKHGNLLNQTVACATEFLLNSKK